MKKISIIIVRHGETLWNTQGRWQGQKDSPLTENGMLQAKCIAQKLKNQKIDFFYSSDLQRALNTSRIIGEFVDCPIITDIRLRERSFGVLQGLTEKEMKSKFPEIYESYKKNDPDFVIHEGESARQCFDRNILFFEEIIAKHTDNTILVVTHGGVLDAIYRYVQKISLNTPRDFDLYNASVNLFSHNSKGWRLDSWGDISHLCNVNTKTLDNF